MFGMHLKSLSLLDVHIICQRIFRLDFFANCNSNLQ